MAFVEPVTLVARVQRRDGTIRDTVMYSLHRDEWPEVRAHLNYLLNQALTVTEHPDG